MKTALPAPIGTLPATFEDGMLLLFQTLGYHVIGGDRTADGLLVELERGQTLYVAYCLPALMAVSSADVNVCAQAMDRCHAVHGYVVTRSWFFPAAISRAKALGIELVDSAKFWQWLNRATLPQ